MVIDRTSNVQSYRLCRLRFDCELLLLEILSRANSQQGFGFRIRRCLQRELTLKLSFILPRPGESRTLPGGQESWANVSMRGMVCKSKADECDHLMTVERMLGDL